MLASNKEAPIWLACFTAGNGMDLACLMYTRDNRRAPSFACLAPRRYETSYTFTYVHLRAQEMDPAIRRRGRIHKQARHTLVPNYKKKVSVFSEPNLHRRVLVSRFTLFDLYVRSTH
jgi:hypothetical protein